MKTRCWILIFSVLGIICILLSVYFFFGMSASDYAYVYSDSNLVTTLPLNQNTEFTVHFGKEWNTITVHDGKIAVTASSCMSRDCIKRGYCNGGAPIVCLPNHLVIEFTSESPYDALIG